MTQQVYVQKPMTVVAQVLTPAMIEELKEREPGLVKYASAGDYLVTRGDVVVPAEQFRAEFESEEQHQLQHVGSVLGLIDQLGGRVGQLEQRVTSLAAPVVKALEPEAPKPAERAKGK